MMRCFGNPASIQIVERSDSGVLPNIFLPKSSRQFILHWNLTTSRWRHPNHYLMHIFWRQNMPYQSISEKEKNSRKIQTLGGQGRVNRANSLNFVDVDSATLSLHSE